MMECVNTPDDTEQKSIEVPGKKRGHTVVSERGLSI